MVSCMNDLLNIKSFSIGFFRYNVRRRVGSILCCAFGRHSGNYLALTYVFVKLLYIANAIGQLFLLNIFMGRGFSFIGIESFKRWFYGQDMEIVERFPRISMCKFVIRTLGDNIQPFDVQCLLPINIYNEKVEIDLSFIKYNLEEVTYGEITDCDRHCSVSSRLERI